MLCIYTPRLGSSAFRTPSTILETGVVPSGSSQAIASKRHFLTILTFKRQTCQSVKPYRSASTCVQLEAMARSSLPTTWLITSEFTSGCHFAEHVHNEPVRLERMSTGEMIESRMHHTVCMHSLYWGTWKCCKDCKDSRSKRQCLNHSWDMKSFRWIWASKPKTHGL